ncbi:hypothetical protein GO491_02495 [Flavobacteriaceae bacterium Ap0902]|nr:hypothetical protein [Flavobacteriaceae bacterium Ap0902]
MKIIIASILSVLFLTSCATQVANLAYEDLSVESEYIISNQLDEISGLQYEDNLFYGFNDSEGEPEIYTFNLDDPESLKTIRLKDAKNVDWEDMAMSDSLIFIGDFGNNIGNRKDQTIYTVRRADIDLSKENQTIDTRPISFFYPEQKNFDKQPYQHDFDMESMVYFNDEIHLFTKEWKSEKTHHFTLDLVKGIQPAWLVEDFDLGFLATGADVIQLNNYQSRLAIVGYNRDGEVFLMLTDFKNKDKKWLDNPHTIIKIGEADQLGQVEGVAFKTAKALCISAEAINSDLGSIKQNVRCMRIN